MTPPTADTLTHLRHEARRLFRTACEAADPALALQRALAQHPLPRPDPGGGLVLIALGKAALAMTRTALSLLPSPPRQCLVVTNYENAAELTPDMAPYLADAQIFAAGHPVPDENGARAARAVIAALAGTTAADRVVVLISGGGSALLPAPVQTPAPGISLDDKIAVNRLLLKGGFDIAQTNLVRQNLSRLKGGGLARLAAPAPVTAYILSDVIGDDLRVIASGPTASPIGDRQSARALLQGAGLWDALPAPVRAHLQTPEQHRPAPPARNILIGSNRQSIEAVVAAAGPGARIASAALVGDVGAAAQTIFAAARQAALGDTDSQITLVSGGETTVILRGTGLGGRNQELALRVALDMPDLGRDWVFLSGGTDGRDGPTDAAGGLVDGGTAQRIIAAGADPHALLANNDSHAALISADDLLVTGATGTNVADVQILLLAPRTD